MNNLFRNFIYMSDVIGLRVIDTATGRKIGKIFDLAANMKEMLPEDKRGSNKKKPWRAS